MNLTRFLLATLVTFLSSGPHLAAAETGPGGTGGGDDYVVDFIKTAILEIHPWLAKHGATLKPKVDAGLFLLALDPQKIVSADHVFESCDGSMRGREVPACFNAESGYTYLSRTRYPLKKTSPAKLGLIAHEVFRKMGIEGDRYEITKQMPITQPRGVPAREIKDDEFLSHQTNVVLTAQKDIIVPALASGPFVRKGNLWCWIQPRKYERFDRALETDMQLRVVSTKHVEPDFYGTDYNQPNCNIAVRLQVDSPLIKAIEVHRAISVDSSDECVVKSFSLRVEDFRSCMDEYLTMEALPPVR